jgi:hypothetical protein
MASSTQMTKDRIRKQRRRYRSALRRAKKGDQLDLELRPTFAWGGKRDHAGRPRTRAPGLVPHVAREAFRPTEPLHVVLRMEDELDMCAEPWFDVLLWALRTEGVERVRYAAYSAQGNHLHLVLEAVSREALAGAISALKGRVTAVANAILGRKGPVFVSSFHTTVLRSPTQVRNALAYLVENAARHAAGAGRLDARILRDPFTSLGLIELRAHRGWGMRAVGPLATVAPQTWLLRTGWQLQ